MVVYTDDKRVKDKLTYNEAKLTLINLRQQNEKVYKEAERKLEEIENEIKETCNRELKEHYRKLDELKIQQQKINFAIDTITKSVNEFKKKTSKEMKAYLNYNGIRGKLYILDNQRSAIIRDMGHFQLGNPSKDKMYKINGYKKIKV
jgi:exonuclease VII large subunit